MRLSFGLRLALFLLQVAAAQQPAANPAGAGNPQAGVPIVQQAPPLNVVVEPVQKPQQLPQDPRVGQVPMQQIPQVQQMQPIPQVQPMQQIPQVQPMQPIPQVQPMQQIPQVQPMQQIPQVQPMQQIPQPPVAHVPPPQIPAVKPPVQQPPQQMPPAQQIPQVQQMPQAVPQQQQQIPQAQLIQQQMAQQQQQQQQFVQQQQLLQQQQMMQAQQMAQAQQVAQQQLAGQHVQQPGGKAGIYAGAPSPGGAKEAGQPLYPAVNGSHAGPIAPHEMDPEQMRQLAAAQGLYPGGNEPGAGDTAAQWEALMADFVPDMIVTFKLPGGGTEHFHQVVGSRPTLIRGGFFESMTESGSAVSFTVISPTGKIAYMSRTGEGVFKFETKEAGQYTFAVHNAGWMGAKYVTFVVGAGVAESLTQEDVESLDGNVKMLYRMLYDMETHASYTWRRMKSHLEGMHSVARHTYYALLVQLAITGLATVVQLNVIKRMVSHRRMF